MSDTIPQWMTTDTLALSLIKSGLSIEIAYEISERAAIVEEGARVDRRTAILCATGGLDV